ncbi:MAG: HAD-IIIC family phosphatase [Polyangiaceae bacterium]
MGLLNALDYPFDSALIVRKQAQLLRALSERSPDLKVRVALLGGATTDALKKFLHLFLLRDRIEPVFYESEYNRFYEDVLVDNAALLAFSPQIVVVHTSSHNLDAVPALEASAEDVEARVRCEVGRFEAMWDRLAADFACTVIQNNFDAPAQSGVSHLSVVWPGGTQSYITRLNSALASAASARRGVLIHDIALLSSILGLDRWHSPEHWYAFKLATSLDGAIASAHSSARLIGASLGKTRKCLVLDLDNTLWGGVIGDDGLAGLKLGKDSAQGEAYGDFQRYCLGLKRRGILLAVASKNDDVNAKEGFSHPDSVLKLDDFSAFVANWGAKDESLRTIARELNIGLDSLVFVDDNPAERELVREQLPDVAVPEVGANVALYASVIERGGYFERTGLSREDLDRSGYYTANRERETASSAFANYAEYLNSLQMRAEIAPFSDMYFDRIAQLANKTNQFNLTTRRYSIAEIRELAASPRYVTLYGRLADRFGDNGLVSLLIAEQKEHELHVDLWLMSCRVLKRDFELAMFDALVKRARELGVTRLLGYYSRTPKNDMVADHFDKLGFSLVESTDDGARSSWRFDLPPTYAPKNNAIKEIAYG